MLFRCRPHPIRLQRRLNRMTVGVRRRIAGAVNDVLTRNHHTSEIRIHPLLNAPNIPTCVIESVIHHEYLHHILGAHHNRKFKAHVESLRGTDREDAYAKVAKAAPSYAGYPKKTDREIPVLRITPAG